MSDPAFGRAITVAIMLTTVVVWIVWDVFAFGYWGGAATISRVMTSLNRHYWAVVLAIVFAMGVLVGHWFVPPYKE